MGIRDRNVKRFTNGGFSVVVITSTDLNASTKGARETTLVITEDTVSRYSMDGSVTVFQVSS